MFKSNERLLLFISFITMLILIGGMSIGVLAVETINDDLPVLQTSPIVYEVVSEEPEEVGITIPVVDAHTHNPQEIKVPTLSDEEIMARIVYSEARGEKLLGQVAVAYTILNRVDYYGETVESIVREPNQYSYDETVKPSAKNFRAVIIAELIKDFIPDLFPDTMMWFKRDDYHTDEHCGKPYMQIGRHYFNYLPESENKE